MKLTKLMHDLMEHRPDTRKLWVSKLYSLEKRKSYRMAGLLTVKMRLRLCGERINLQEKKRNLLASIALSNQTCQTGKVLITHSRLVTTVVRIQSNITLIHNLKRVSTKRNRLGSIAMSNQMYQTEKAVITHFRLATIIVRTQWNITLTHNLKMEWEHWLPH